MLAGFAVLTRVAREATAVYLVFVFTTIVLCYALALSEPGRQHKVAWPYVHVSQAIVSGPARVAASVGAGLQLVPLTTMIMVRMLLLHAHRDMRHVWSLGCGSLLLLALGRTSNMCAMAAPFDEFEHFHQNTAAMSWILELSESASQIWLDTYLLRPSLIRQLRRALFTLSVANGLALLYWFPKRNFSYISTTEIFGLCLGMLWWGTEAMRWRALVRSPSACESGGLVRRGTERSAVSDGTSDSSGLSVLEMYSPGAA